MAEDPAAAAGAQAVVALLAEAAATARRDARDEYAVARPIVVTAGADLDDGADRLVAEDRPRLTSGTSPLRMWRSVPQIVDVSIRTIASVGSTSTGSGTVSQARLPGP